LSTSLPIEVSSAAGAGSINTPTLRSQTWRDFTNKVNRKLTGKVLVPWMRTRELDIINEVLYNIQPEYCLEWGSGLSTVYFPNQIPSLKTWYALEHHKGWFENVQRMITGEKVNLQLVEPDDPDHFKLTGKYNPKREGLFEDFKTYILTPKNFGHRFDFIFIDGRARKECLKIAFELVSENGVVVVHDANRDDYFTELPSFSSWFRLTDYRNHRKEGGIWIGRKHGRVEEILRTDLHTQLWKQHNLVAKLFFLR